MNCHSINFPYAVLKQPKSPKAFLANLLNHVASIKSTINITVPGRVFKFCYHISNEFVNLQPNDFNMVKFVDVSSQVTFHTLSP